MVVWACKNVRDICANCTPMLRYIPRCDIGLLYKLHLMCPILASYFDITYFEMLQLIYPSCPGAIEARSQGDGIIVHKKKNYVTGTVG